MSMKTEPIAITGLIEALLALAACTAPPEPMPAPLPTAVAEMVAAPMPVYFPVVQVDAPLVVDQRTGPEMCMAWSALYLDAARADFGWQFYYHYSTWRQPADAVVPIVRSRPGGREDIAEQLLYLKSIGWSGLVILANEPDMPDQDAIASPKDMAGLYWYATQILPDATFITPNTIDTAYLDEFLDYATMRRKDRVGVHIYQGAAGTAVHTWPGAWMAIVDGILARHGVTNQLWISEAGIDETWAGATARAYAAQLMHSRAEVVCIYTTNHGTWEPGRGYDLYNAAGELTPGGQALMSVVRPSNGLAAYP
jgi:hypothetical protein